MTTMPADRTTPRFEGAHEGTGEVRSTSSETKAAFKTTELLAYLGAVIGVIVMSYLVKTTTGHADYFRADKAMFYIVLLTLGYLGSRGLAKAGSHDHDD